MHLIIYHIYTGNHDCLMMCYHVFFGSMYQIYLLYEQINDDSPKSRFGNADPKKHHTKTCKPDTLKISDKRSDEGVQIMACISILRMQICFQ